MCEFGAGSEIGWWKKLTSEDKEGWECDLCGQVVWAARHGLYDRYSPPSHTLRDCLIALKQRIKSLEERGRTYG